MYTYLLVICVPAPPSVGNVFVGGMRSHTHRMAIYLPTHIGWQDAFLHA